MVKMTTPKIKFVNLHGHSCASIFDGLGYPAQHIDFAIENGLDALAITDHGNMNNLVYQVLHTKAINKKGIPFKSIYGVEAYHTSSIKLWEEERAKSSVKEEKGLSIEDEETKSPMTLLNKRSHLVLLAKNQVGLNNLFKLVSDSHRRPNYFRFPRVDYDMLGERSEGLVATSACAGGVLSAAYWDRREDGLEAVTDAMDEVNREFKSIFGDDWYGEIQFNRLDFQHEINKCVMESCRRNNIKVIATADAHYPRPELWRDREMYKRLGWKSANNEPLPESIEEMDYKLYPKNGDQMFTDYKQYTKDLGVESYYDDAYVIEAIERSYSIAHDKIETFFPENEVKLPSFVIKDKAVSPEVTLINMAIKCLEDKGWMDNAEYKARLSHELQTVNRRGFAKYFLTMKAMVDFGRTRMLIGPGRGSAAGSLLSYVLDITEVDSIRWECQFERFLLEEDTSYPDIDVDYSDAFGIKEALIAEWGEDSVVPITNFNTLKIKSLIKDICKFFEIDFQEVNDVTSKMLLEAIPKAKKAHGIKTGVYDPTYEELKEYSETYRAFLQKYPHVEVHVEELLGMPRSISRHAGGVIVGEDLSHHMPLITSDEVVQTPWAEGMKVRHCEPMGFIKFDLLGLQTLKDFEECIFNILKRYHNIKNPSKEEIIKWYKENLHSDSIDFADQKVWEVFKKGAFLNTFQFAESAAQAFCVAVSPSAIPELATITSIQRPGPLEAGVDKSYLKLRENPEEAIYLSDVHKEVTEETYSLLVFQEQIALMAHKLGKDLSLNEGNYFRKLLTKKGTGAGNEAFEKIHKKFMDGCAEKGIEESEATSLYETMEFFSGYGFNKSHAISYSIISFQCAFLLTYYPECWCAATLTNQDPVEAETITQVKGQGFEIMPPSLNYSTDKWEISPDGKRLYQPLTSIRGIGAAAYDAIIKSRPFRTIEDLLFIDSVKFFKKKGRDPELTSKNRPGIDKGLLDVLIRVGALDELMDERFENRKHFWTTVAVARPKKVEELENLLEDEEIRKFADFTKEEYINFRVELTKSYPLDEIVPDAYLRSFKNNDILPATLWDEERGPEGKYWFIVMEKLERATKNGKPYCEITIIDSQYVQGKIKIWWIKDADLFEKNGIYIAENLIFDEKWGFSFGRAKKTKESISKVGK